jgi:hypothetical protein
MLQTARKAVGVGKIGDIATGGRPPERQLAPPR